jgi:anti-sigma factor RsiW
MTHVTDRIQAWLDGELSPPDAARFQDHIQQCPHCRRELDACRRLWELVDTAAPVPELAPLWPRLAARLRPQARPQRWSWSYRGLAVAASAAGLLLGWQLGGPVASAPAHAGQTAEVGYLDADWPSLDQLWLQLENLNGEAGS